MAGLRSGCNYSFRVRASNMKGHSSWSESASAATLPAEPSPCPQPTFAARTSSSVRVRWEAPAEDGGAAVTSYRHAVCKRQHVCWTLPAAPCACHGADPPPEAKRNILPMLQNRKDPSWHASPLCCLETSLQQLPPPEADGHHVNPAR